jgi:hypothetical protein
MAKFARYNFRIMNHRGDTEFHGKKTGIIPKLRVFPANILPTTTPKAYFKHPEAVFVIENSPMQLFSDIFPPV